MLRFICLLPLLFLASACAMVKPLEDEPRILNFTWNLTPEHYDKSRENLEQGDIFFEWKATTAATHQAVINGQTIYLGEASTNYGHLYCTFGETSDGSCYEDRDADGWLDLRWTALRNSRSPGNVLKAKGPTRIDPPIAFTTAKTDDQLIATQTLGLLYNGPVKGTMAEDGTFDGMVGELALGWFAGKSAPRDPTGLGWKYQNSVVFAILPGISAEVSVKGLGLHYTAIKASVDGELELEYQAEAADGVDLSQKFDYDVDQREENPADPEV